MNMVQDLLKHQAVHPFETVSVREKLDHSGHSPRSGRPKSCRLFAEQVTKKFSASLRHFLDRKQFVGPDLIAPSQLNRSERPV